MYCKLDFYGVAEDDDDACDNTDKRTYLGSIRGYLILTHLMELMCESIYKVCGNYSGELETIMTELPKVVMKNYPAILSLSCIIPSHQRTRLNLSTLKMSAFIKWQIHACCTEFR